MLILYKQRMSLFHNVVKVVKSSSKVNIWGKYIIAIIAFKKITYCPNSIARGLRGEARRAA